MEFLRSTFLVLALLIFSPFALANTVNINTADATLLADSIKGVGPDKAAAIVSYREKHGPFKSVDDLVNVKGIGAKTVKDNRELISIE